MSKSSGKFITFEGTEGAGKSTLIAQVAAILKSRGKDVVCTREPGGTKVAERIRSVILEEAMDPWTELFLYEAARAEHMATTVRPALEKGQVVLCDRFTDSTLAYQSHARGLPWQRIQSLNRMATQGISPHLTVLLDIDPAVGLARAMDRNRFEEEGVRFQEEVRKGFLKSRAENPRRWLTLKVEGKTPESLAAELIKKMEARFKWRQ